MKLNSEIAINGKNYPAGSTLAWYQVYPFFLVHMLAFGLSGFYMAYTDNGPSLFFLYMHGGIAIFVYVIFFLALFGAYQVKWMVINAGLGLLGIYVQIDIILSLFGKQADQFPWYVHLVPFVYYILYTFLLYQLVLEVSGANQSEARKKSVEYFYVVISILIYLFLYFRHD